MDTIGKRLNGGSVERLKKTADSGLVYMLFCNICVRNEDEKCYVCGYDNLTNCTGNGFAFIYS